MGTKAESGTWRNKISSIMRMDDAITFNCLYQFCYFLRLSFRWDFLSEDDSQKCSLSFKAINYPLKERGKKISYNEPALAGNTWFWLVYDGPRTRRTNVLN